MESSLSYLTVIVIVMKLSKISSGKSKRVKLPNIWLIPLLFIAMIFQDCSKASPVLLLGVLIFAVFFFVGVFIGLYRGKTLKYHQEEEDQEVYYQESYQSLVLYILLIAAKWLIQQFSVGPLASVISLSMLFFACGSMIGRCLYLTAKYLSFYKSVT